MRISTHRRQVSRWQQSMNQVQCILGACISFSASLESCIAWVGMQDERTQRQISRWLRSLIKVQPNFGACIGSLNTFFTEHAKLRAPVRPALPAARQGGHVSRKPSSRCMPAPQPSR